MKQRPNKRHPKQTNEKSNRYIWLLLIATFICLSPNLNNDFLRNWDDHEYVLNNADVKDISFSGITKMFSTFYIGNYQPLTMLSYAIDHALFGFSARAYHGMNLLFHLINTYLVYLIIFKLTKKKVWVALTTAMFFGIHPCHVESVSWIAERKDVLYTAFFLASIYMYQRYTDSKNNKHYLYCSLLFIASCLSKSAGVVLPLVFILFDYFRDRSLNFKSQLNKLPFLAISLVFGIIALISQQSAGATTMAPQFDVTDRIFLSTYPVIFYIIKAFAPFNLSAMYYYPLANESLPLIYYLSPLIIAALCLLIVRAKHMKKELIFSALFYLINILLIIQIIPLGRTLTADRYTYVPYIGFGFLLGQLLYHTKNNKWSGAKKLYPLVRYGLVTYTLLFGYLTWERSKVWKDTITVFTDVANKYPDNSHPYLVRAAAEYDTQDYLAAGRDFTNGIMRDSTFAEAWNNRGNVSFNLQDYKGAIKDYSMAIDLDNNYQLPYNNRGTCKKNLGEYESALEDFNKAIAIDSSFFIALHNRALTKHELRDYEGAIQDYNKTIALQPNFPDAYSNRGVAKYYLKDYKGAIPDYDKAIELNPNYGEAYGNRAAVKFYLKDRNGACSDWKKADQLGYSGAKDMLRSYCK